MDTSRLSNLFSTLPTPLRFSYIESFNCANFTLQNTWILSHILSLLGTSLFVYSMVSENSQLQQQSYKISTLGSFFTYLIVLIRAHTEEHIEYCEAKSTVVIKKKAFAISVMLKNENAQLLGYVMLWHFTKKSILKLIPFFLYSFLNVSNFFVLEVFPHNQLCVALIPLLSYLEAPLLIFASYLDLAVFFVLLKESIAVKSAYSFIIYFFLFSLRFENSKTSRSSITFILRLLDDQIEQEPVPISIRSKWTSFRKMVEFAVPYEYANVKASNVSETYNDSDCSSSATTLIN